jgi:hypothetical protein
VNRASEIARLAHGSKRHVRALFFAVLRRNVNSRFGQFIEI